jgi:hypothetical protein
MSKEEYKIICHAPSGRVIAHLDPDGTLTVHHDHFTDDDSIDVRKIIEAFDKWSIRREIRHLSKRGLNTKTVAQLNALQEAKPGNVLLPPLKENNE